MAQTPAEYQTLPEITEIMKTIVSINSTHFSGVDVDVVRAYAITNKDRSEKQKKMWDLKSVPMPIKLDCPYSYYVIVYLSDWDSMLQWQKGMLVLDMIHALPNGLDDEGKVNPMDLKDYSPMIRTFGADYLLKQPKTDILSDPIKWEDEPTNLF